MNFQRYEDFRVILKISYDKITKIRYTHKIEL